MLAYEEKKYKKMFLEALDPFLDFLEVQQEERTVGSWMEAVQRTQVRIMANPEQYLGKDLPSSEVIKKVINEIFDDFISDHVKPPVESLLV